MSVRDYFYKLATDQNKGFFPALFKMVLWLLSLVYGLMVRFAAWSGRLRLCCLPCKVISVGNITVGGTGKTSLVELIAQRLTRQGHTVAVISRGYKRYNGMGDEPYMLQEKLPGLPVIVDADRIRASRRAVKEFNADTVILDDAFQQWRIKKDLEVVTIDTTNPFGNRHLLPRGILREPLNALRRADIFVATKANLANAGPPISGYLAGINPGALIVEAIQVPVAFYEINKKEPITLGNLKGRLVGLISGIGSPDSFEELIKRLGIEIGLHARFSDHYRYRKQDIDEIVLSCQQKHIETLITTEKDAVRLRPALGPGQAVRVLVLRIKVELIKNEQGFNSRLFGLYRA